MGDVTLTQQAVGVCGHCGSVGVGGGVPHLDGSVRGAGVEGGVFAG